MKQGYGGHTWCGVASGACHEAQDGLNTACVNRTADLHGERVVHTGYEGKIQGQNRDRSRGRSSGVFIGRSRGRSSGSSGTIAD